MRFFDFARLAPQLARSPIHFAQAVENRSPDAELGIRAELHMLGEIKLVERIDQPNHSGMHQVFEGHVPGQPFMDAARQIAHLGQLFEQDAVALFFVLPDAVGLRCTLAHDRLLTSLVPVLVPFFVVLVALVFALVFFPGIVFHRNTPTDCTSTTGGTSSGESTTTLGRKGSSKRFR